ncbi:unnamed protein product [Staurois parvus]|uniref:Uncharacterized protein n=1 Tax=Staurois parvus TaxID=386267 RepID=A0ABN9FDJ9_9NEOB|nr:unnamed protein product [Staurois parvus]
MGPRTASSCCCQVQSLQWVPSTAYIVSRLSNIAITDFLMLHFQVLLTTAGVPLAAFCVTPRVLAL